MWQSSARVGRSLAAEASVKFRATLPVGILYATAHVGPERTLAQCRISASGTKGIEL